jgi:hypothetical protein
LCYCCGKFVWRSIKNQLLSDDAFCSTLKENLARCNVRDATRVLTKCYSAFFVGELPLKLTFQIAISRAVKPAAPYQSATSAQYDAMSPVAIAWLHCPAKAE